MIPHRRLPGNPRGGENIKRFFGHLVIIDRTDLKGDVAENHNHRRMRVHRGDLLTDPAQPLFLAGEVLSRESHSPAEHILHRVVVVELKTEGEKVPPLVNITENHQEMFINRNLGRNPAERGDKKQHRRKHAQKRASESPISVRVRRHKPCQK